MFLEGNVIACILHMRTLFLSKQGFIQGVAHWGGRHTLAQSRPTLEAH